MKNMNKVKSILLILLMGLVLFTFSAYASEGKWYDGLKGVESLPLDTLNKYSDESELYKNNREVWDRYNDLAGKDSAFNQKRKSSAGWSKVLELQSAEHSTKTAVTHNMTGTAGWSKDSEPQSAESSSTQTIPNALIGAYQQGVSILNEAVDTVNSSFYGQLDPNEFPQTRQLYGSELVRYKSEKDFLANASVAAKSKYCEEKKDTDWWAWNSKINSNDVKKLHMDDYSSYEEWAKALKDGKIQANMTRAEAERTLGSMEVVQTTHGAEIDDLTGGGVQISEYDSAGWDPSDPIIYIEDENLSTVVRDGNEVSWDADKVKVLGYKKVNDKNAFYFKSINYNRLTYKEKKEFMTTVLKSIRNNVKSSVARTKAYNFIKERDGDMEAAIKLVAEETTADLYGARNLLSGVLNKVGTVMGILSIMIFSLMALTMVMDIAYIVLPGMRLFLDRESRHGQPKRPFLVSAEAWKATTESEKAGVDSTALSIYLKKRVVMIFALGVMMLLILTGKMYDLMGWIVDSFSGVF